MPACVESEGSRVGCLTIPCPVRSSPRCGTSPALASTSTRVAPSRGRRAPSSRGPTTPRRFSSLVCFSRSDCQAQGAVWPCLTCCALAVAGSCGLVSPCPASPAPSCGWRRQEGWVETEDFRLLTCEVCARLSSMRAPLPAGRPRGAQDRGHVKPLQQGSGMGHTQVPVPIRRHAASPSRHRLCLRLSTLGCTRCLLCAAEQSSRRGQHPAGASPAGRGRHERVCSP